MEDMIEALQIYFSRANAWTPLWVTLKTGIAATFITDRCRICAFALIQQEQTAWKDIESGLRSRDSGDMGGLRHCGGGHFFSTDVPQYTCSL